jgi:hypothetical protein
MNKHATGARAGLIGTLMALLAFAACEGTADSTAPGIEGSLPEFGTFRDVEPPSGDGAAEPWLSLDGEERVILSWLESSPEGHALRFSIRHEESWGPVRTVVSRPDLFVNWADFPSVIRLPDGSLAAHWLQRTGAGTYDYGVRIARSTDEGISWSDPVTPHTDGTPTEHGFVSLFAGAEAGAIGAVWLDGRNYAATDSGAPFMTLRAAEIAEDGSLGAERVLDPRTCDCCQTGVARSGSRMIVAYRGRTESEVRDIRVVRGRHDTWSEPLTVHEDGWTIPSCPVNGPAIGASGNRVAVSWFTAANDSPRVLLAWSDDSGVSFGAPQEIAGPGEIGEPLGRVDLEVAPEGHVLVSWLHEREGTAAIMLAAVAPNGARAVTTAVPRLEGGRATGFPRLVMTGRRVLLAWTEPGDPSRLRLSEAPVSAAH